MPLYEFYCEPCHTIFTFRAKHVDTATVPKCPDCGAPLQRQISPFAHITKGGAGDSPAVDGGALADAKREDAIAQMANRMDAMAGDDADPADAVKAMRQMAEAGGLHFNKDVREAMARIEAGEDPEKIDDEFKDVFDAHDPFENGDAEAQKAFKPSEWLRRLKPPRRDPVWRDL